jgi:hypothetical protein
MAKEPQDLSFLWGSRYGMASQYRGSVPFRGPHPLYKNDEPHETRAKLFHEPKVQFLDLSRPEDIEAYQNVLSLCANGRAQLMIENAVYDQELHTFRVLLTYVELYYEGAEEVQKKKLKLSAAC